MATNELFRTIEASRWHAGGEPVVGHYEYLAKHGIAPQRWNDAHHYALYTSHDPDTAFAEKMKWYRKGTWAGASTGTAKRSRVVIMRFEAPALPPGKVFDGETSGLLTAPDITKLMAAWDHAPAQAYAARHFYGKIARAIVPSSPIYLAGGEAWNSVLYVARGLLRKSDLPRRRQITKVAERLV